MTTTYKRIEAVKRAGEVLRYLADQKQLVSGADVAKQINMPVGTTMCHLVTLEDMGYVQQIGEHWKLGMGLALFWARVKSGKEFEMANIKRDLDALETGGIE